MSYKPSSASGKRRYAFILYILPTLVMSIFLSFMTSISVSAAPGSAADAVSKRSETVLTFRKSRGKPDVVKSGTLEKSGRKIRYRHSNGKYFSGGWKTVKGKKYYFAKNSYALTGLHKIDSKYYIFSSKGELKKGWIRRNGHYYYASVKDGALKTGWQKIGKKTYYLSVKKLYRLTGLQRIGKKYYYFNGLGVQQRKNHYINGKKIVFKKDGSVRYYNGKSYDLSKGQQVVNYACKFVGNPYKWGGSSLTRGADCSGFVMAVYARFGVSLPHYDAAIRKCGRPVDGLSKACPGDVICYRGHVAIYMGNNRIVHAADEKRGICIGNNAAFTRILSIRRFF